MLRKHSGVAVLAFGVAWIAVAPVMAQMGGGGAGLLAATWDDPATGVGVVRALAIEPPWDFVTPPIVAGPNAVARSANGRVYVVSRDDGTITVIDVKSWTVSDTFALGAGSEPRDISVIDTTRAYVTRATSSHLLRLNPSTGTTTDVVDLSVFADADGVPEMNTMAMSGNMLFVQLRRMDTNNQFVPPAMLAVVDLTTETIVDADPDTAGVQAIQLQGTAPKGKMQLLQGNKLYVSATGGFFDAGGLEEIDTNKLVSNGLVIAEADGEVGADLGPFVFVLPGRGFLVFSTDFATSSHLHPFSIRGGVDLDAPISPRLGYLAPVLTFDKPSNTMFFPDGPSPNAGVLILDGQTGAPLRPDPVPTASTPNDFAVIE